MNSTDQGRGSSWGQMWRDIASPELSTALQSIGTNRKLQDGQLLYQRGDPGNELYGVRSGLIRVQVVTPDGVEVLAGLYTPGTWFGEVTLFDDLPRPVSTFAIGPTEVLVVTAQKLRALLDGNPIWYRDFARVMCNKLRLAMLHIEASYLPMSVRIALRLLDLAKSFGKGTADGVLIGIKLPQEDLARMLGLTRQSVNKELGILEQNGWLAVKRGQITLKNVPALVQHIDAHGGAELLAHRQIE